MTSSAPTVVYDDALAANWQDWSWSTHNLGNLSPVSAGTDSISVDFTPYAGLSFYLPGGVSTAGAANLEFDVNGGTAANQAIAAVAQITVTGPWGPEINIAPYCAGGAIRAGAFTHCRVPLSALQIANTTFQRIAFKEVAGLTLPRMYFDQIAVVPVPAQTVVYDDALAANWQDWSWSTHNLANLSPVSAGTRSISVDFTPYAGLSFYLPGGVSTSGAANLEFDVNGGTAANQAIAAVAQITVTGPWGPEINIAPYCSGGAIPAGAFTHCRVPLIALQIANTTFQRIAFKEVAGRTLPRMYFDQIAVVSASGTPVPVVVSVLPHTASVTAGGSVAFAATVTGVAAGHSTAVNWSVTEAGGGTVTSGGVYTAPGTAGTYHVVATSVADTSKSDIATVTVTPAPVIAVAISPHTASVTTGGTVPFTATVSGAAAGQSTAVSWSVQEAGGGTVSSTRIYSAPGTAGTYHVVATSVADPSKADTATVTVTASPPVPIAVSISPDLASALPGGTVTFTATVTGATAGQSTAVNWSVQEPGGGTVDSSGLYTAPAIPGTYHVVATSVADPSKSGTASINVGSSSLIPADRLTTWNPGVPGGIPARTAICATVNAASFGNGASDATAGIQAAINACPTGQVVQLSAGTFTIDGGNLLLINKGITLRGAGPDQTTLQKTDGAKPNTEAVGLHPSPLIIVGPARWSSNGTTTSVTGSTNLAADAVKGAFSVTVASTAGFSVGQNVLLDELSGASWQTDPGGRGQIWASPDFRVVWQLHNPAQGTDDPLTATIPTSGGAASWFCRQDRPTSEIKQIASISGTTITFSTPVHISYRVSHNAQLSFYGYPFTQNAGVESLKLIGGDNGQLRFQWCSQCWAKSIDNTVWHDEGFAIDDSFRVEIRDSYVHDAAWAQPGGAGYAISLSAGSSEVLIENNISFKANKVMVARCAGAGSVFGYNYVDDGYINTNTTWIEVGLNASHMVGPHHVLFEGNYGFNWDSDKTHGSAIYHTIFRNHLRGVRRDFGDNLAATSNGPRRCGGAAFYSYWHSFVGNVLGAPGLMTGWVYQSGNMGTPAIWLLGWDDWNPYPTDPQVASTTLRHGNYDYVTNSVVWDPSISNHTLPPSLYLSQKPAFFNAGRGYVWPWVDPTAATPVQTLPAKARFDAGTPFVQP